jgi:hypothetical protein
MKISPSHQRRLNSAVESCAPDSSIVADAKGAKRHRFRAFMVFEKIMRQRIAANKPESVTFSILNSPFSILRQEKRTLSCLRMENGEFNIENGSHYFFKDHKRAAKFRPSLRDEECAHFIQKSG